MSEPRARHLYDRPIGVLAILAALLVLGGMTLPSMRINLKPEGLTAPLIYVTMSMDTESSAEALEQLTRPTEEILRSLPGVNSVSSRTRGNKVSMYVMPAANISLVTLITQVSEALDNNSYRLPSNSRPRIGTFSESDPPMVAAAFNSGDYDEATFRDLMEREMVPALLRVPGVAVVSHNLEGQGTVLLAFARDRVTATKADLNKITSHFSAAQPRSYQFPVVADGTRNEQMVSVRSADLTQSGLADVRISNGNQLKQIAIVEQLPSNYGKWVLVDGKPGCTISVYPSPDANSYAAAKEVTKVIGALSNKFGIPMVLQSSTHIQIDAAAWELFDAAMWGALFSVAFLLIFLGRFRLALLVCASLPLSLALAVLMMACHNNSLNLFTLMGFLLACGMVVDNAIVVGEAMMRVRQSGDPTERTAALRRAVSSVSMAIIVSTLTTIALFIPILVVENPFVRVFVMSIGEPIIWSLLGSLAVALILVPMAFPRLYRTQTNQVVEQSHGHAGWMRKIERLYGRVLAWFMLRPLMSVLFVALLIVPGLYGYVYLKKVPRSQEEDNRYIRMEVRVRGNPSSAVLAEAFSQWYHEIESKKKDLSITSVICEWQLDRGNINLYLDPIDPLRRHENDIEEQVLTLLRPQLVIALDQHMSRANSLAVKLPVDSSSDMKKEKASKEKHKSTDGIAVKNESEGKKEGSGHGSSSHGSSSHSSSSASSSSPKSSSGSFSSGSRLSFRLVAPDEAAIDAAWGKLRTVLETVPGITNAGPTTEPPATETELVLTRDAEERGWRADQLASQVTRFAGTRQLLTMPDGWALTVGPLEHQIRTLESVNASEVIKSDGDIDRLENLVSRGEAVSQVEIRRRDGLSQRDYSIYVEADKREEILDHMNDYLIRSDPPPGVQIALGYMEEHGKKDTEQMILATVLAGTAIYFLMGILYESILAPLALMLTVPIVYFSVQACLKFMAIQLDNMVQVGLFLLIGVVVNHGVVLVDRLSGSVPMPRLDRRRNRYAVLALAAGARRRFTPVVLTSLVTIAAAFPMIFGNGRFNGDSIAGLGASLAVGMTCGLFFTLFVVPLVYRWLGAIRAILLRLVRSC